MHNHDEFMRHAIELAANVPDRPFGVVIVDQRSGEILSEGWNKSSMNPIWHGEIDAINRLVEAGHDWKSKSLTLYTTAEPCPMCQGAILWTGIETVVFGTSIRFLQNLGWKQCDISADEISRRTLFGSCTIIGGIMEEDCNRLFEAAAHKSS